MHPPVVFCALILYHRGCIFYWIYRYNFKFANNSLWRLYPFWISFRTETADDVKSDHTIRKDSLKPSLFARKLENRSAKTKLLSYGIIPNVFPAAKKKHGCPCYLQWHPQRESNSQRQLRRLEHYPLCYGDTKMVRTAGFEPAASTSRR